MSGEQAQAPAIPVATSDNKDSTTAPSADQVSEADVAGIQSQTSAPSTTTSDAHPTASDSAHTTPTQAESNGEGQSSVFSGWGFDVNAVTNNIGGISNLFGNSEAVGGLFATPDSVAGIFNPSENSEKSDRTIETESGGREGQHDDDLGATASNLANAATNELEHASRAAQHTIGKAAEELGRGWGTLNTFIDDMLAPEDKRGENAVDESQDIHATFRKLFPHFETDDEVVDHYRCTLLQKYRCLNNATPEKAFPLRGRLFVTMSNIAMYVTDDGGAFGGNAFGVNIPFEEVIKIQKGAKAMLRVLTKAQTSFIFAEFESDTHYNGALSLLEQLHGAASGTLPPPTSDVNSAPGRDESGDADKPAASG